MPIVHKSPLDNIYIRLIFGSIQIFIGLILLKLYLHKNKDNIWGQIYRHIYDLKLDFAKMTGVKDPKTLKSKLSEIQKGRQYSIALTWTDVRSKGKYNSRITIHTNDKLKSVISVPVLVTIE